MDAVCGIEDFDEDESGNKVIIQNINALSLFRI